MAEPTFKDLIYRTAANVIGGPVDLATMVMRPFGYKVPEQKVVLGSEWIGKKMEDVGLVSTARAPLKEFLASVAVPTPGGMAKSAAIALPAFGGIFIGKGARTWDALAAARAKELEAAGVDARVIWKETGTWKGPDGKWRQEISDVKASPDFRAAIEEGLEVGQSAPMGGLLGHKELYKAYPDVENIPVYAMRGKDPFAYSSGEQGKKYGELISAPITAGEKDFRSSALHELQHAIQRREGFARGGSPAAMGQYQTEYNRAKAAFDEAAKTLTDKNVDDVAKSNAMQVMNFYGPKLRRLKELSDPQEAYRRLAGEAEARATQARINMNEEQRRATFPLESFDVKLEDLIVRSID